MHVALTDVLTCPRCGPGHGLILLPEEVHERRVVAGFLGCPDCRTRYPIRGGVADLRASTSAGEHGPDETDVPEDVGEAPDVANEGALRLAALLGLGEADGVVLIVGPAAADARALSALVPEVEVVATLDAAAPGVSVARVGGALPFQSGRLRGVALTGEAASRLLEEGARVVAPAARLLLDPAPPDAGPRLRAAGLRVVAEEGGTVVAVR